MMLMQQYVRFTQGHIHDGHVWLWVNHALVLEQVCYLSMSCTTMIAMGLEATELPL